ncbi:hypothetical protein [Streptomyces sp. ISL-94]|nr:hypothetical protein [Streptomyces sp. ISL-94]
MTSRAGFALRESCRDLVEAAPGAGVATPPGTAAAASASGR